ncbi:MAG: carbonic anhydrase [Nitrospinae bacterium]|nr:carbonic anhydrase [Nitrospinota bacterium]
MPAFLLNRGLLAIAIMSIAATGAWADSAPSPDGALMLLKEGNDRYVSGKSTHPRQDAARRGEVAKGQNPFAVILSCSDSREPVELIFDQGIGDLFIVRIAGNVADTDEIGSIEYGAGHLKSPLVVVLGHTKCGAVTAVVKGEKVHGSIPKLVDNIIPAAKKAKAAKLDAKSTDEVVAEAIKTNVFQSIEDLLKKSGEVAELMKKGELKVIGAVYDIESGKIEWLGPHPEQARFLTQGRKESGKGHAEH